MYTPESINWNEIMIFMQCAILLGAIIIIFLLFALIRALSKRAPTVDDPTGEKKQQIFDGLTRAIEDVKTTV